MIETEKAWLAGMIDGEGCIWTRHPKRSNVVVEISMTDKATIERIQELFAGRVSKTVLSKAAFGSRPQWRWATDTRGTRTLLIEVLPYLFTKYKQAQLAILLCERPRRHDSDRLANALRACH